MIDQIQSLDANILLWIQEHLRADWLNPIMKGITHLGDSGIFWIILCLALLIIPKTRKLGLLCTLSLILEVLIVNVAIKPTVARIRPYEAMDGLICLVGKQKDFSFPSGHSSASLAVTGALMLMAFSGIPARGGKEKAEKWFKIFACISFALGLLICFTRLYVGVHYPSDVVCGSLIGFLSALLVYVLFSCLLARKEDGRQKE